MTIKTEIYAPTCCKKFPCPATPHAPGLVESHGDAGKNHLLPKSLAGKRN
jgi:hypothetical protein